MPKSIPLEKRKAEGTMRTVHRRKEATAPKVEVKTLEEVPGLTAKAKKHWPFFKKMFAALPVAAESDIATVQRMLECYAEVRECQDVIIKEGRFYRAETKEGYIIRAHPAVSNLSEADRRLRAYLTDFGMTPAARTKVQGNDNTPPQDPLKDFGL